MSELDIGELLADQIRRLMEETGPDQHDAAVLWPRLLDLGLDRALISEGAGGQGLEWADLVAPLVAWGGYAAPAPLAEALVGGWLLDLGGFSAPDAPVVLEGYDSTPEEAWTLTSRRTDEGDRLSLTSPSGDTEQRMIATGLAQAGLAVALAAQIAGALQRSLELSVDHASARTQFGRPLGKFQSVQRLAADLGLAATATRAAVDLGISLLPHDPLLAASIAKGRASRAVGIGTACAHQIHGAIGVTEEYPLHRLTMAMWRWRDVAGDEFAWGDALARRYLPTAERLWPVLIDDWDRGTRP
ncbi:MAG: hypothetical protein B7Z09_00130 [Brevundimonas diminuta]|nr:MAG: hypothetical protein B7Z09_00130 [Brevundimonas diminuta]